MHFFGNYFLCIIILSDYAMLYMIDNLLKKVVLHMLWSWIFIATKLLRNIELYLVKTTCIKLSIM